MGSGCRAEPRQLFFDNSHEADANARPVAPNEPETPRRTPNCSAMAQHRFLLEELNPTTRLRSELPHSTGPTNEARNEPERSRANDFRDPEIVCKILCHCELQTARNEPKTTRRTNPNGRAERTRGSLRMNPSGRAERTRGSLRMNPSGRA